MPLVSFKEILQDAFDKRYGVPAFNILNDLTMEAVLSAAEDAHSPIIIQTSVKTVKSIGIDVLYAMWIEMTRHLKVPAAIHLDHCPERAVISACLAKGWSSVLFDASALPIEENRRQTIEVVAEARRYGAGVEGEIEGIKGVEDGVGSDEEADRKTLEVSLDFIRATGVDCFAPAIGNAHGVYKQTPKLRRRAGDRNHHRDPDSHCPARRNGLDERAVPRSDRSGLRESQHLDGSQDHFHAIQPGLSARG